MTDAGEAEFEIVKHRLTERDHVLVAVAAIALVAIVYMVLARVERSEFAGPQARLEMAREELRSGDDSGAFKTFEPLAKSGNARAQFWLADMYEHGYGVKKNIPTAIDWLTRAADQGLTRAEARLGQVYLEGDETLQDFATARKWLTEAAMIGDAISEQHLGRIFDLGLGVPRNQIKAYAWYECAVLNGDDFALRLRDELTSRMTPDDITKAQSQTKDLWAEIRHSS